MNRDRMETGGYVIAADADDGRMDCEDDDRIQDGHRPDDGGA